MNNFTDFFTFQITDSVIFIKIFALVLLLFHLVFSYILLKQVQRMILVVEAQISPAFLTVAYAHLIASALIFLWVLLFV